MADSKECEKCEFYEYKIERLNDRQTEMWLSLDNLQRIFGDNNELHDELQNRTLELSNMQHVISDLQVFLFSEREENLRLAEENDKLKIALFDESRALKAILNHSGITRKQLLERYIDVEKTVVANPCGRESRRSCDSNSEKYHVDDLEKSKCALNLEVQSLRTQLENLRIVFRNEVDVLLKDREVVAEERIVQTRNLEKELCRLNTKLQKAEYAVCDTVKKLFDLEKTSDAEIEILMRDKNELQKRLLAAQHLSLETKLSGPTMTLNGIGTNKNRALNVKQLQDDLMASEKAVHQSQRQARHFELEMKKWKEKAVNLDVSLGDQIKKLTAEIAILRGRNEGLDRRRILEASGFKADIKLLRDKLKDMDQKLNKIRAERSAELSENEKENQRVSSKQTLLKAKQLERELAELRVKVASITDDRSQWMML